MPGLLKDRRFWLLIFVVGAVLAVHAAGLTPLSLETLRAHRQDLTSFVAHRYALAALAYIGIYILAVVFSVPGALLLTLVGGFLFGAFAGTAFTVIGATVGATLIFVFARAIFGANALDRFGPSAVSLAKALRKNAWSYLFVLRLIPLFPFFLVNLVPAFAGVGLVTYVLTTFFGIMPATLLFSLSGAGLGDILDRGGEISARSVLTPQILATLAGIALLSLAAIPLRQKLGRKSRGEERLPKD
jgi:uncharacterized membrane protein YdjX (TVP38/TMEM64 family)